MSTNAISPTVPINYFVCTLDEAVGKSSDLNNLTTVSDFIDFRSKTSSKDYAVGFPVPASVHGDQEWRYELFTFEDLKNGSISVAAELNSVIAQSMGSGTACVALLCPSSIEFLFAWLALMGARLSVLLIAPQCQPAAIAHLCKSCDVSVLIYHDQYAELASKAASEPSSGFHAIRFPWQTHGNSITDIIRSLDMLKNTPVQGISASALENAFIFHTSGTSTGLPKPIPQSHNAAFRVLPVLDGRQAATFTTTPLYHGGIADCFRAWTSGALIWLFPGADVPITTQNMLNCISIAEKVASKESAARVKYFSCVPYVLQMLIEDASGLRMLQKMEIVGVGGAALSPKIGNELVEEGVNLVSRFGSAECGFLLASHRHYNIDRDWQYLRYSSQTNFLSFEKQEDNSNLFELVVRKEWPHMTKSNREDGSLATGDLFDAHPSIKGAWRYHSRSDSQITLTTGKKFDPAPLEDAIQSNSSLVREAMIFGTGRQEAGVLVFPSKNGSTISDAVLEESVWDVIHQLNIKGQAHTRISKNKMAIMPANLPKLDRSSKGTLLRGAIEKKFADEIEAVYNGESSPSSNSWTFVDDCDIKAYIREIFTNLIGSEHGGLTDDADFYGHGIDSTTCTRIRSQLQNNLLQGRDSLPWNIVYDCGNINRLAQYILDLRTGNAKSETNEETQMLELVEKYSAFDLEPATRNEGLRPVKTRYVVLLTGATGALGAHILNNLRNISSVLQVICLVRATAHSTAASRVSESLTKRKKAPLEISDSHVQCLPCKLNHANLGLSVPELSHIRNNITHVIHAAWAVNFSLSLHSFVDEHITGIYNLLNLTSSCQHAVHFTFCSSAASVLGPNRHSIIEEKFSANPSDASSTGYSRSKWVAEAICFAAEKILPGTVDVLRIGQLTGNTETGVWNMSEAWPLMLSTVDALDCLPNIEEPLSWLPLDTAATAVLEITFRTPQNDKHYHLYHLVNNSTETTWSDLLKWIEKIRSKSFDIVPPTVWLEKLEKFPKDIPAKNLLGLWKNVYENQHERNEEPGSPSGQTVFSLEEARKVSGAMQKVRPIDEEIFKKIWSWLQDESMSG